MEYPTLNVKEKFREVVDVFNGYNHNLRIGDGEFYDMKNMTSDHYPALAPRGKRGEIATRSNPTGIVAKNNYLCQVAGTEFYIGSNLLDLGLDNRQKQIVAMGSYIIILPDKVYVNTNDLDDNGKIEAMYSSGPNQVTFELSDITGELYAGAKAFDTAPDPDTNPIWIDTSSTPHTLKKYSNTDKKWIAIATTYVKISADGIGKQFKQYDGVTISGIKDSSLKDLNSTTVLWACGDDYIVVPGILDETITQTPQSAEDIGVEVVRNMPNMDFVIESENRLWGCKYGKDIHGNFVNEIYASKLGDFRNWNCFMGLSTDSYVASCGTDGPFTAAFAYLGYPLFFKENCVHKVYGNYPSNFQIQTTACRGVQKGNDQSLAVVNETLFYKSRGAVCAYDGSFPVEISAALGNEQYGNAIAGSIGNKYYINMRDSAGNYHLFVYDTAKGMWHKEDDIQIDSFCSLEGELYAISGGRIITMLGFGETISHIEQSVNWMVQSGPIGMETPDMKYVSKLMIRMSLALGSKVRVFVQYDSVGEWEQVCQMTSTSLRSFSVPIRPRRCDHFRVRIEGDGDARIYSITRTVEKGSDFS